MMRKKKEIRMRERNLLPNRSLGRKESFLQQRKGKVVEGEIVRREEKERGEEKERPRRKRIGS